MKKSLNYILAVIAVINLFSIISFTLECEYAINPTFEYARPFSKSTAVGTQNNVTFTTDRFGNFVSWEGKIVSVRSNGLVMVVGDNDLAAFYDVNGYRLTDFVYDTFPVTDIKTGVKTYRFGYYDGDGESDLVPFSRNKKYGFINSKGVEVIPPKYEYAYGFVNGMALICAEGVLSEYGTYTNGKYGMLTQDGREVLSGNSYWVGQRLGDFGYGVFYNGSANRYLADKKGNVIKADENGYAPIDADFILCETSDGRKGVAVRNGKMIIPLGEHSTIEKVNNQFVVDNTIIVDGNGNTVYRTSKDIKVYAHYINIYKHSNLYRITKPSAENSWMKLYGMVNAYGKVVFEPEFTTLYDMGEGLIFAQKDNKNYLYSYYGEQLCQLNGNNVGECVGGLFPVFDFTSNSYGYMLNPLLHPKVYVNGDKLNFDVYPKIENNRTLVPLRGVFEALGADIQWDDSTKTVTAVKGDITVKLQIGSNILYKNGNAVEIDVPAKIENDRTLVPLRAVSEAFACAVSWDGANRIVNIDFNNQ